MGHIDLDHHFLHVISNPFGALTTTPLWITLTLSSSRSELLFAKQRRVEGSASQRLVHRKLIERVSRVTVFRCTVSHCVTVLGSNLSSMPVKFVLRPQRAGLPLANARWTSP